jgi:hypothetical protein
MPAGKRATLQDIPNMRSAIAHSIRYRDIGRERRDGKKRGQGEEGMAANSEQQPPVATHDRSGMPSLTISLRQPGVNALLYLPTAPSPCLVCPCHCKSDSIPPVFRHHGGAALLTSTHNFCLVTGRGWSGRMQRHIGLAEQKELRGFVA